MSLDQKRILVVEDEPHVGQALWRALTLLDPAYGVEAVESAEAALDRLEHINFDVVVTDFKLPGMSGLELLEHVRQRCPSTRTILITAYGTAQVEDRGRRLADVYLPKPFGMRDFISTVQQALYPKPDDPTPSKTMPHGSGLS